MDKEQLKEADELVRLLKDYLKPKTLDELLLQERIITYIYEYGEKKNGRKKIG